MIYVIATWRMRNNRPPAKNAPESAYSKYIKSVPDLPIAALLGAGALLLIQ